MVKNRPKDSREKEKECEKVYDKIRLWRNASEMQKAQNPIQLNCISPLVRYWL